MGKIRAAGLVVLAALIAAGALFALSPASALLAPAPVKIVNFAFQPAEQTVEVGGAVEWVNQDGSKHTVTFDSLPIDSGDLDTAQTFSATFAAPGRYTYYCARHSSMLGAVNVVAAQTPTPTVQPTALPAPAPTLTPQVWQPILLHE